MKFCINCMAKIRDTKDICPFCGQVQDEGVKSSFHLLPGFTLSNGRYLVGKAVRWDGFSITYMGRDLVGDNVVSIQEYMPEAIVRRQTGTAGLNCISKDVLEDYQRGLQCFIETADLMKEQSDLMVNTVRVLDSFYENGTGYVVLEYLNGQSVQKLLDNGHIFTWDSAKQVIDAVLEGVISLNQAGIYHQDIYPGCILLTADGQIKLSSPGGYRYLLIGKKIQRASVVRNGYSAEEQYRNKGEIGPYTDVYGAGAVMFHMLTGKKPLSAADRIQKDTLQIPKEIQGSIPQNIRNALSNSLQVLPQNRTETPRKFQRELSEKKVEKIVVKTNTGGSSGKKTAAVIAAAVVGLCVLGAAAVGMLVKNGKAQKELTANQENLVPNLCGLTSEAAEDAAQKAGMQVEIVDKIPSAQPLDYVVSQTPEVNQAVDEDNTIKLTVSGSNETVMLFNSRGKAEKEALETLKSRNLDFKKERDVQKIYTTGAESEQIEKGQVIAVLVDDEAMQEENRVVEQKTHVILQVSLGDYESEVPELTVPNLQGKTKEEAKEELNGLNSGGPVFELAEGEAQNSLEFPKGEIISQDIEEGEVLRACDENGVPKKIVVTLSLGPREVTIPDVKYLTEAEAIDKLEEEGLQVSVQKIYSSAVSAGKVIGTSPQTEEVAHEGDEVILKVSIGPEPPKPVQNVPQNNVTPNDDKGEAVGGWNKAD